MPTRLAALMTLGALARRLLHPIVTQALSWGSTFSAMSLAIALAIALASLAWPRLRRRRAVRLRALVRGLFPQHLLTGASSRADLGLWLFNTLPGPILLSAGILSAGRIGGLADGALIGAFGPVAPMDLPPALARAIATLALFLAYDLGIWANHVLFHRAPFLWEFHKVHHTAEALSPLTVFRVHPIESLMFANITAVAVGLTAGALHYALGPAASPALLSGTNVILLVFLFLTLHLQHSKLWISFTGLLGRILVSPAHHQFHHSADPAHFNRNFGSCLALWDWAFGTLHVPPRRRERLTFGAPVRADAPSPHSLAGTLFAPFAEAVRPWRWSDRPNRSL